MAAWTKRMKSGRKAIQTAVGSLMLVDRLEQRFLLAAHPVANWYVNGSSADDVITVRANPNDANMLQAVVNGKVVSTRAVGAVRGIQVAGLGGDDQITIDLGADYKDLAITVNGGAGNDSITGGSGGDYLLGGLGNDSISGSMGDDNINGGAGNDLLSGDEGDDLLTGGIGIDTLAGGLGNDTLNGSDGADQLSGGYGDDVLYGASGIDTLTGGDGADSLYGGAGKDTVYHESLDSWNATRYDVSVHDQRTNPLQKVDDPAALKQKLIDAAVEQWKWAFGEPAYGWWYWPMYKGGIYYAMDGMMTVRNVVSNAGSTAAPEHSTTNNQVQGVDEADIVKTDGNYLYLVHNNELVIMEAWPADQTHIISRTTLDGWSNNIFLDGDRLTIVSSTWAQTADPMPPITTIDTVGDTAIGSAKIGLSRMSPFWWGGWGKSQVTVTVLDVSDRTAPKEISKTEMDGSLSSTRDIDGRLYLVLNNNLEMPRPNILPGETADSYVYESRAAYVARLEAMTLDDLLPQYKTTLTAADGSTSQVNGALASDANLYLPTTDRNYDNLFSVTLMDLKAPAPQPKTSTSVVGFSGTVYASANSLYVSSQSWDAPMGDWQGDCQTDIYKFELGTDSIGMGGTGQVPGWALNEFAMDESKGYFRIATTTETDGRSNNVFVMQDSGDTLDVTGAVTSLALGERIYAARFVGDRAYLVTFRQTDPLFTLDLSDPNDPQLKGELKIPGYSSYLHPVGDNLLIGFGRDADANGRVKGLQVSLFDVSDLSDPKRIDVMSLDTGSDAEHPGWWSSYSEAEWDHHAFSYFAGDQVLAVPVLDWNWWNGSGKLEVLKVDATTGFSKLGEIQQDGQVLRSVQIGDFIYSIGSQDVKVVAIADPSEELANVVLDPPTDVITDDDDTGEDDTITEDDDTTGGDDTTDGDITDDDTTGGDTTGQTEGSTDDPTTGGSSEIVDVLPPEPTGTPQPMPALRAQADSWAVFQTSRLVPAAGSSLESILATTAGQAVFL